MKHYEVVATEFDVKKKKERLREELSTLEKGTQEYNDTREELISVDLDI